MTADRSPARLSGRLSSDLNIYDLAASTTCTDRGLSAAETQSRGCRRENTRGPGVLKAQVNRTHTENQNGNPDHHQMSGVTPSKASNAPRPRVYRGLPPPSRRALYIPFALPGAKTKRRTHPLLILQRPSERPGLLSAMQSVDMSQGAAPKKNKTARDLNGTRGTLYADSRPCQTAPELRKPHFS